jgi:flavin-binding protein dodecin
MAILSDLPAYYCQPESAMNDHVYKTIEITGSSATSADDAIRMAIEKASTTVKNLRWFKVLETRGNIEAGKVAYWQVTIHLGFTLE